MSHQKDLKRAREIVEKYGFTGNEKKTAELLISHLLMTLSAQLQLYEGELKQLDRTIRELEQQSMSADKRRATSPHREEERE